MRQIKDFDLNLLVTFETIYSTGNITKAAETLSTGIPSISLSLTKLRTAMDDTLFVRSGNGVEPTELAKSMIGPVREALALSQKAFAIAAFDPGKDRRHFKFSLPTELEIALMPALLNKKTGNQNLTFENVICGPDKLIENLLSGLLDIGLTHAAPDNEEIIYEEVQQGDTFLLARTNHPLLENGLSLDLFSKLQFLELHETSNSNGRIDTLLNAMSITRNIKFRSHRWSLFAQFVASSDLVSLVPGYYARIAEKTFKTEIHELPLDVSSSNLYIVSRKSTAHKSDHEWLKSNLRELMLASGRDDLGDGALG